MQNHSRREFLRTTAVLCGAAGLPTLTHRPAYAAPGDACRLGLVTYLWGKDLTLPQLIDACEQSEVLGLELRTTHRHGVERDLTKAQRAEVKSRFEDSSAILVGIGSNERYDNPDPAKVKAAIDATKDFIVLSHDVGSSGVKVKGDRFYEDVPREKTIAQVASALRQLGDFGADYGQEIRLEVHGGFSDLPVHHEILKATDHPNVRSCWNSNRNDLEGKGLEYNFNLVKDYFGQTAHIRALGNTDYPFAELIKLFVSIDYDGWLLLEARGDVKPNQIVSRLREQKALFEEYKRRA